MKLRLTVACCALVALAGCGGPSTPVPKTFPVRGKVTYTDGKPLAQAHVRFKNEALSVSVASKGPTGGDGSFELKTFAERKEAPGAPEGEYEVEVIGPPGSDPQQPILVRVVRPEKVKVEPRENDVKIEVEQALPTP